MELLFADDCAVVAHSEDDLQRVADHFSTATKRFGLIISLKKTEVLHQPAPGEPYVAPNIYIDGHRLNVVNKFTYLGSSISDEGNMDSEIDSRIAKASAAFGALSHRVWKAKGIRVATKVRVYQAMVMTTLLYGCETWTCYATHNKWLEVFHQRKLREILHIHWSDHITNAEVLERARLSSIEARVRATQLRWTGHVMRMPEDRLPKKVLFGELTRGIRPVGRPKLRYKDTLKQSCMLFGVDPNRIQEEASDREKWYHRITSVAKALDQHRASQRAEKRRKHKLALLLPHSGPTYSCTICGRECRSKIGLHSHMKAHEQCQKQRAMETE